MPEFAWQARSPAGEVVRGEDRAPDPVALARALGERGLVLTRVRAVRHRRRTSRRVRLRRRELILLTHQLADALGAGIPLVETLAEFSRTWPSPRVRRMLELVYRSVESGSGFADALARWHLAFPRAYVEAVRAAEETGRLDRVFAELAEDLEWQDEIASKVTSALLYPAILLAAVAGVGTLFVTVLFPKLKPLFEATGVELPLFTRVLLAVADLAARYWFLLPAVPAAIAVLGTLALRTDRGRLAWHRTVLALPGIRRVVRHLLVARFARTAATLLDAGTTMPHALQVAGASVDNIPFSRALARAREDVTAGSALADALERTTFFGPLDVRMIAVGERSGTLVRALGNLVRLHERQAKRAIQAAVTMLEPILLVLMAAVVLGLALSVFMPIYQSLDAIGR